MITSYPQEAWCGRCHVSHPPGTRRCLHCGQPVLPVRPGATTAAAGELGRAVPIGAPEEEEAEAPRGARPLRIGIATLWLILAAAGAILRSCAERG
jgi:hypothetical protein